MPLQYINYNILQVLLAQHAQPVKSALAVPRTEETHFWLWKTETARTVFCSFDSPNVLHSIDEVNFGSCHHSIQFKQKLDSRSTQWWWASTPLPSFQTMMMIQFEKWPLPTQLPDLQSLRRSLLHKISNLRKNSQLGALSWCFSLGSCFRIAPGKPIVLCNYNAEAVASCAQASRK